MRSILWIDDSMNSFYVNDFLGKKNKCDISTNIVDAVKKLQSLNYDAIILDGMLPLGNIDSVYPSKLKKQLLKLEDVINTGLGLMKLIRRGTIRKEIRNIPIIFLSAFAMGKLDFTNSKKGLTTRLYKPLLSSELTEILEKKVFENISVKKKKAKKKVNKK